MEKIILPEDGTLNDVLRMRAQETPNSIAYTFLSDEQNLDQTISYIGLYKKAQAIAQNILDLDSASPTALMLFPSGLDFIEAFFGCLYSGVIAVPAYPPRRNQHLERLQAIVQDSKASIILTTTKVKQIAEPLFAEVPELNGMDWLCVDDVLSSQTNNVIETNIAANNLAFLQYTSGSTGLPKGVMVSHANLVANERMFAEFARPSSNDEMLGWLPLFHDMGLIGMMLNPVYMGYSCAFMSPASFLQKPLRWLQAISDRRSTMSVAPNFAYELCIEAIKDNDRRQLDLSCWQQAMSGAEPVRLSTLQRFAETFAECGFDGKAFRPGYGLAEATLFVTGFNKHEKTTAKWVDSNSLQQQKIVYSSEDINSQALVSNGIPYLDCEVIIVDPQSRIQLADDAIGEIWIKGSHVAQGYWQREEASLETFSAYVAESNKGPYLRTGDLGFLNSGELYVTGRIKDLIIINGTNHYPQDIEATVAEFFNLKQNDSVINVAASAAFSIEKNGEEQAVFVIEADRHFQRDLKRQLSSGNTIEDIDPDNITNSIRAIISERHELQLYDVVLLSVGTLPRTSSGKVQRRKCKFDYENQLLKAIWSSPLAASSIDYNDLLKEKILLGTENFSKRIISWLRKRVAYQLKVNLEDISMDALFSEYGLDSLGMMRILGDLNFITQQTWPADFLWRFPTLNRLSEWIESKEFSLYKLNYIEKISGENDQKYPLTYSQRGLWFLDKLVGNSAFYNNHFAFILHGQIDVDALEKAINYLLKKHSVLCSSFHEGEEEPFQIVNPISGSCFLVSDFHTDNDIDKQLEADAQYQFSLSEPPLIRFHLIRLDKYKSIISCVVHHIISDGLSFDLLLNDLSNFYSAAKQHTSFKPEILDIQYIDYAVWQRSSVSEQIHKQQLSYWKKQLSDVATLNLPADYPRPPQQVYDGGKISFSFDLALSENLKSLAKQENCSLFMLLMSIYGILLHKYSRQNDIVVGTSVAGRTQKQTQDLIGFFVNLLPLRMRLKENFSFKDLLSQVKEVCSLAIANQDVPFEKMVDTLHIERDITRHPLVQVMFALRDSVPELNFPDIKSELIPVKNNFSKFDLLLECIDSEEGINGYFEYSTALYSENRIKNMAGHFVGLAKQIISNSNVKLSELCLLTTTEKEVIESWNNTKIDYPDNLCIHHIIEQQVDINPDAIALIFNDANLTYESLNKQANQYAHYLIEKGVKAEDKIGICLPRSSEMVIAALGILKAGAAYLPLDSKYPEERLTFMLDDAKAKFLLTEKNLNDLFVNNKLEKINIDECCDVLKGMPDSNPRSSVYPDNIAYIIYTSGSTGTPKATMTTHRGLVNLQQAQINSFQITADDRVLQFASFSFDASAWEFVMSLCAGATLVLIDEQTVLSPDLLANVIEEKAITVATLPPTVLGLLKTNPLRKIIAAGEASSKELAASWAEKSSFINAYGPSETTVCASYAEYFKHDTQEPCIGKPIQNTKIYIVDTNLQLVPAGVPGELCIEGVGVGRGYWQRPDLTAKQFIPSPFGSNGERLYRTGDLARYRTDGNLEFVGRIDDQVKVRGFRIELGEIENCLKTNEFIEDSVVIVSKDILGINQLVAYIVKKVGSDISVDAIREYLSAMLPHYMLPSGFMFLDTLPLTVNGKINKKALPKPEFLTSEAEFIAPQSETEKLIAGIWEIVLNREDIGVNDNFFELGGHSLLASQVIAKVRDQFDVDVPMVKFFKEPTIAMLETLIVKEQITDFDDVEVLQLLAELEE